MWTADNHVRFFNAHGLQARWNIAHPDAGFDSIRWNEKSCDHLRILQCRNANSAGDPEDELIDTYLREDDLVATYVQAPKRVNRKQVYLRPAGFLYPEPIAGIEIVFSMQTERLDGDPQLSIRSEAPTTRMHALVNPAAPQWETLDPTEEALDLPTHQFCGAFATELSGSEAIFAQVIDPSDFLGGRWIRQSESSNLFALSFPVFGSSLEKGVIRRGRVTGLFLPNTSGALDSLLSFYQWYRESPPMLTT